MNMTALTNQVMSSIEIAELTGKRHDNVMADIRRMMVEIQSPEKSGDYQDGRGRTQPCLLLDKEETICLVSGYSAALRIRIIRRWQELEQQAHQPAMMIPPDVAGGAASGCRAGQQWLVERFIREGVLRGVAA